MDNKKRKAKRTRWLGIWLFLVCAMFSAACSKSVIGSYGAGAAPGAAAQPKPAPQYAAVKTIQASPAGVLPGLNSQAVRVGQAVRRQSSPPLLKASSRPAGQIARQPARQVASRQPAWSGRNAQSASSRQLSRGKASSVRGDMVCRTVRGQVGTRYKYGGSTPGTGFDCSGLLAWAYKQHGVSIPRTAKAQSAAGRSVGRNKLAPGDIVVFRIKRNYHTGMYAGGDRFIHSPSSGSRVREDRLDDSYWKKAYIGARRVI